MVSALPRMSGLKTRSVQSAGATSSMPTEIASSAEPSALVTACVIAAASFVFCSRVRPECSLTTTCGIFVSPFSDAAHRELALRGRGEPKPFKAHRLGDKTRKELLARLMNGPRQCQRHHRLPGGSPREEFYACRGQARHLAIGAEPDRQWARGAARGSPAQPHHAQRRTDRSRRAAVPDLRSALRRDGCRT